MREAVPDIAGHVRPEGIAQGGSESLGVEFVGIVLPVEVPDVELAPEGHVEEPGFDEGEVVECGAGAEACLEAQGLSPAEEVLLGDLGRNDGMIQGAVSGADAEHARRFFLDADVDIRQGFIGALLGLEIDLLEIAQPVQGHVAVLQFGPAVEIPFDHGELAADDLVARLGVAGDVDPVEIDQFSLGDLVGHVDGLGFFLRFGAGDDVGIGVSLVVADLGQVIHVLHDRFAVVEVLLPDLEFRQQIRPGGCKLVAGDRHLAHAELLSLRNGDLDGDSVPVMGDLGLADLGVDEAVVQVEGVDLAHILFELVLLQEAGVGEEVEDAPLVRGHHVLQFLRGEGPVALEGDVPDEEFFVFDDD